jgi:hypothetical protein
MKQCVRNRNALSRVPGKHLGDEVSRHSLVINSKCGHSTLKVYSHFKRVRPFQNENSKADDSARLDVEGSAMNLVLHFRRLISKSAYLSFN